MKDNAVPESGRLESLRVTYGATVHDEAEINAVDRVLRSSTQMGEHVRTLEERVSDLFAKEFGIMVNSGSSANYLAVEILGLPPGSEVITPALTFSTTVAPLIRHALIPSFIDVQRGTYNIDVGAIEEMITPNTSALMIPSLIGNLPDWDVIAKIAERHDLVVIEDSADTLGARLREESTGTRSDISTTSFYGSHIINCAGNGGMLCVNDPNHAKRCRLLRGWGRSSSLHRETEAVGKRFACEVDGVPYDTKFVFEGIGYNFLPSEVGAAFGLVQLGKLDDFIRRRQQNFKAHMEFFDRYEDWFILPKQKPEAMTAWLAFPLTVRDSAPFSRRDLQVWLEKHGVQTRPIFTGNVLRQPGFSTIEHREAPGGYPETDLVMRGGILLGCHHGLGPRELDHIHECFSAFADSCVR